MSDETMVSPSMGFDNDGDGDEEKKNNTPMIIGIVAAVVLCCCCSLIAVGWFYGDSIMASLNF